MQITTNISDVCSTHDAITYPAIEKQVYDLLAEYFNSVEYSFDRHGMQFVLDGIECSGGIPKKKQRFDLAVLPPYHHEKGRVRFGGLGGDVKYPSVKLPFNTDVEKRLNKFVTAVKKIRDLEERAKAIGTPDAKKIKAFLNAELGTKEVEASYWNDDLFDGLEIHFYLHPKGEAPAEGVLMCVEKDTLKLNPFWNGSTPRRSHGGNSKFKELLDWAIGRRNFPDTGGVYFNRPQDTIEILKKRIEAIERVQAKVAAFDPNKSEEFLKLIDLKRKADELLKEFKAL